MMRTYGIFSLNGKDNPLRLQQPYFVYFYTNHNVPSITLIDMGDFHGNSRTPFHLNSDAQFPCQAEINALEQKTHSEYHLDMLLVPKSLEECKDLPYPITVHLSMIHRSTHLLSFLSSV